MGGCSSTATTKISAAAEEELRKIVLATSFPGEYFKERGLVFPFICKGYTRRFEESAKDCAGLLSKWDSECQSTRKRFIMCQFIRDEVENLRKPVKEAEAAELEMGWWDKFA